MRIETDFSPGTTARSGRHHFFGAGPVLDAFPGAQLMACDQQVVDEARGQTTPAGLAIWNSWFAGQFSPSPVVPALASSQ
jgi:hypothetical protein